MDIIFIYILGKSLSQDIVRTNITNILAEINSVSGQCCQAIVFLFFLKKVNFVKITRRQFLEENHSSMRSVKLCQ